MPRRSLMLAGGGLKIAFQAGVLEVLLDEAGLEFDHADAVSAACFNLAMWTQGMSGQRIADNWRNLDPVSVLDTHLAIGPKLLEAEGLFDLDKFRTKAFPAWGLDFEADPASRHARRRSTPTTSRRTNFGQSSDRVDGRLFDCVCVPAGLVPAGTHRRRYLDRCDLQPPLQHRRSGSARRGRDLGHLDHQPARRVAQRRRQQLFRNVRGDHEFCLQTDARACPRGCSGTRDQGGSAGALSSELQPGPRGRGSQSWRGVRAGMVRRQWLYCSSRTQSARQPHPGLRFAELARGRVDGNEMEVDVEVHIDDLDRFLSDPHHGASLTGHVRCPAIGGDLPIIAGTYNLFVDDGDPGRKRSRTTWNSVPIVLIGEKDLRGDPRSDPATVRVELLRKNVAAQSGTLTVGAVDFLKHLASFRSGGRYRWPKGCGSEAIWRVLSRQVVGRLCACGSARRALLGKSPLKEHRHG